MGAVVVLPTLNVFANVLFWRLAYVVCRYVSDVISPTYRAMNESDKAYWGCSVVSTMFSLVIVPLATYSIFSEGFLKRQDFTQTSSLSDFTFEIFVGYLLSDISTAIYQYSSWTGATE